MTTSEEKKFQFHVFTLKSNKWCIIQKSAICWLVGKRLNLNIWMAINVIPSWNVEPIFFPLSNNWKLNHQAYLNRDLYVLKVNENDYIFQLVNMMRTSQYLKKYYIVFFASNYCLKLSANHFYHSLDYII